MAGNFILQHVASSCTSILKNLQDNQLKQKKCSKIDPDNAVCSVQWECTEDYIQFLILIISLLF